MNHYEDTVNQAISDFDDIEEAIEDMGVDVPEGTPTSEYSDLIRDIETGTDDHSELDNLEYENSGHTGFQKEISEDNKLDYALIDNAPEIPSKLRELEEDESHTTITAADKIKLAGLENYDDTEVREIIDSKQDKITSDNKLSYNLLSDTPPIPSKTSDLTNDIGYITDAYHDDTKVDKDGSKVLSDNNYTTVEKTKLANLENYDDTEVREIIDNIEDKIPTQASSSNQLADKSFVNSSINSVTAYYITKNASGEPFSTKAELTNATVFYSGGEVRVPTRNDYCVVLEDESKTDVITGEKPTTRYIYQTPQWEFQFIVNKTSLTAEQLEAINSGITDTLVEEISDNTTARHTHTNKTVLDEISSPDISNWNNKVDKDGSKMLSDNNYTTAEKEKLAGIDMSTKQDVLVSGTNIKTVNNQSILGSGNLEISGGQGDVKIEQLQAYGMYEDITVDLEDTSTSAIKPFRRMYNNNPNYEKWRIANGRPVVDSNISILYKAKVLLLSKLRPKQIKLVTSRHRGAAYTVAAFFSSENPYTEQTVDYVDGELTYTSDIDFSSIFVDDVLKAEGTDYTRANNTITFKSALTSGAKIIFSDYISYLNITNYTGISDGGTNAYRVTWSNFNIPENAKSMFLCRYSWDKPNVGPLFVNEPKEVIGTYYTKIYDKVDKEAGKGLSSNDYTDDDKTKVDEIEHLEENAGYKHDITDLLTNIKMAVDYSKMEGDGTYLGLGDYNLRKGYKMSVTVPNESNFELKIYHWGMVTSTKEGYVNSKFGMLDSYASNWGRCAKCVALEDDKIAVVIQLKQKFSYVQTAGGTKIFPIETEDEPSQVWAYEIIGGSPRSVEQKLGTDYIINTSVTPHQVEFLNDFACDGKVTFRYRIHKEDFDGHIIVQRNDVLNDYYEEELNNLVESVSDIITEPCIVFPVYTDVHYMSPATMDSEHINRDKWYYPRMFDEVYLNIIKFTEKVKCDFIANLGDVIEGDEARASSTMYGRRILKYMNESSTSYYNSFGNHDDNREASGNNKFTIYGDVYKTHFLNTKNVIYGVNGTNYYKDFEEFKIRFIWLDSQWGNGINSYGYTNNTLAWYRDVALDTPANYNVVVLTHHDFNNSHNSDSSNYTNFANMKNATINYNNQEGKQVIAVIAGHNHYDAVFNDNDYLSVILGCRKFVMPSVPGQPGTNYPEGAIQAERTLGTASEDLWDVCVIRPHSKKINFVRFGADSSLTSKNREYSY